MYKSLIKEAQKILMKTQKNILTKNYKSSKGITLVALVVTIIILIILSTVTINAVLGDNGLIKQAQKSKEEANNYISKEDSDINQLVQEYANIMSEDETAGMLFTITFLVGGSIYKTIMSSKIKFPSVNPTSSEGKFAGWYYDINLSNEAHEGDELTEDITLYAKWSDFTATYMVKGQVFQNISSNELKFPSSNPSIENLKFAGWYYDEGYTQIASEGDKLNNDVTLYAKMTSYIKNKLEGKCITMLNYYLDESSDWYYVTNESELENIPFDALSPGDRMDSGRFPTWVKLRKI